VLQWLVCLVVAAMLLGVVLMVGAHGWPAAGLAIAVFGVYVLHAISPSTPMVQGHRH
jgi:hypothetical protein